MKYDAAGNLLSASEMARQDWQRIMNWAEALLVEIFPVTGKQFIDIPPFLVRYYPLSGTYLSYNTDDKRFYGYNPDLWGADIIPFGLLSEYLSLATQAGF